MVVNLSQKNMSEISTGDTMGKLAEQLELKLRLGMTIPEPLRSLYDWIESRGTYNDGFADEAGGSEEEEMRTGFLFPEEEQIEGWTETGRPGGTDIEFAAHGHLGLEDWFGHSRAEVLNRLCVFARTGHDGSMAALWLDDQGTQKIVHLGSGSGSCLVCVLATDPVDFLRLLAIGYDEICWSEEFAFPPNHESDFKVQPHLEFQRWVSGTFAVSIPATAAEIVKYPSEMDDEDPQDDFAKWANSNIS
jgi:hypothetical protein